MDHMDLVTTTSPTSVTHRMVWIVASLLFVLGSCLIGEGLWIHMKAVTAQWFLQQAWAQTLNTQQPTKPWPWADTWPVGRLMIPRLNVNQIILADASGQSLAFGPGKVGNKPFLDKAQSLIVSGHRDTHFSFLRDIRLGDMITVQTIYGNWLRYSVEDTALLDRRTDRLTSYQKNATLHLITCYPFDALLPGGPLRYLVTARSVVPSSSLKIETQEKAGGGSRGHGMMGDGSWE